MTSTAAHFGETKRRGITVSVNETKTDGGIKVARFIAACIREKQKNGQRFVLGLATGSSPIGVYQELVRLHKEEGLSFANVASYNLDEYYPMEATHKESYHRFMSENLFSHIDIDQTDVHIPDGTLDRDDVDAHCKAYEEDLRAASVDVQLLGIGRDGHIGFNEPGSTRDTVTRKITLNEITREDAAPSFDGECPLGVYYNSGRGRNAGEWELP
eukprot:TRINITY_DN2070_c0_g6_i2.p1 TRINITY_DN2070_c0_g6~~TRINITY_DN2070_c0_g6_i2.p1  ORF type:complete len:214 (+),score=16.64 TRINITY_DN2070_c0_g6_i2:165-806(+)